MRRAPGIMALFFITIAIVRVSDFLGAGLKMGIWGELFSVGLAYSVYVSSSFAAKKESMWSGIVGLFVFGVMDLVYNEFGLVYRLSPEQLIPANAQFLGWTETQITYGMHAAALAFGACPTIFSAVLGWQHSQGEKVKDWNKPGLWARVMSALGRVVTSWGIAIAFRVEGFASRNGNNASSTSTPLPVIDGQVTPLATHKRWKNLTADDVAWITANGRGQVMARFGISDGAAGGWKRDLADGKRPWQSAKKLPENAVK